MNSSLSDNDRSSFLSKKLFKLLLISWICPEKKVSMMPFPPTMTELPGSQAHKPKIGFSIDSIVGEKERSHRPSPSPSPTSPEPEKSKTDTPLYLKHNHFLHHHLLNSEKKEVNHLRSPPRASPSQSPISIKEPRPESSSSRTPSPPQSSSPKRDVPTSPHEIHRPLVSAQHPSPRPPMPGHFPMGQPHLFPPGYPPGMLNFAAMAAAAAAQSHPPHPGMPGFFQGHHPVGPHHPHPAAQAHPLYPWLLAKHSRLFPPRFGPGPDLPGFLFQPFRKPKRIRTAFSPSQLLKLEHAFEKNHYVVGAERKQLAKSLSLSETQVKVWFQNRRTKHKRVEQEDESMQKDGRKSSDHPSSISGLSTSADSSTKNYSEEISDDDEEIVMDEDYSDDEEMEMHNHMQKSYS